MSFKFSSPVLVSLLLSRFKRAFDRHRKPPRLKLMGSLMHLRGMSLRYTSTFLENWFGLFVSHEAVRNWTHRLDGLYQPSTRSRGRIAVDETKLKVSDDDYVWLWSAIDINTREVVAVWITRGRSMWEAFFFMKRILRACANDDPCLLIDRGPWLIAAAKRLGVRYQTVTFGKRNLIERWFKTVKARFKSFDEYFPYGDTKRGLRVERFVRAFKFYYNHVRTHQTLGAPPDPLKPSTEVIPRLS